MTDILRRIVRQPAKLLSAIQAVLALGLLAGWWSLGDDPDVMVGAILLAVSAVLVALSEYVTPTADPQLKIGTIVNGNTAKLPTGIVVDKQAWDEVNSLNVDGQ